MTDEATLQTTVVIPAWDRYVGARMIEALQSLSSQPRAVRLLVVDNASKVALPEIPQSRGDQ